MTLLRLVPPGSKVLRTVSLPFSSRELGSLTTTSLLASLCDAVARERALGAALPQYGLSKRAFAFKTSITGQTLIAVNPIITKFEVSMGRETDWEGCLSLPRKQALVARYKRIWVEYERPGAAVPVREVLSGLGARVFQHELDHLDGILMTDRASQVKDDDDES